MPPVRASPPPGFFIREPAIDVSAHIGRFFGVEKFTVTVVDHAYYIRIYRS